MKVVISMDCSEEKGLKNIMKEIHKDKQNQGELIKIDVNLRALEVACK